MLTFPTSTLIYLDKKSVYIKQEFSSPRIGLEHQHGRLLLLCSTNKTLWSIYFGVVVVELIANAEE